MSNRIEALLPVCFRNRFGCMQGRPRFLAVRLIKTKMEILLIRQEVNKRTQNMKQETDERSSGAGGKNLATAHCYHSKHVALCR